MSTTRIYYNDVYIGEGFAEIQAGCEFVDVETSIAREYAEEQVDSGEWKTYLIPSQFDGEIFDEN